MKFWLIDKSKGQLFWEEGNPESTLPGLEHGRGYWVQAPAPTTIVVLGKSFALKQGWNLIGIG